MENVDLSAGNCANGIFGGGVEIGAQLLRIRAGVLEILDPCACAVDLRERPLPAVFALRLKRVSAEGHRVAAQLFEQCCRFAHTS